MTAEKSVERSVDTLQRIYAVVAALAMNEALKRAFLDPANGNFKFSINYLPELIAFVVTVVPFVHGMNRHLDKTLAKSREEGRPKLLNYLLLDFFVFILESSLLFVLAVSVTSGIPFFQRLMVLLAIDVTWGLITWQITKAAAMQWVVVNVCAALAGIAVIYCGVVPDMWKPWVLAAVAVLRTFGDYWLSWSFYFPIEDAVSITTSLSTRPVQDGPKART